MKTPEFAAASSAPSAADLYETQPLLGEMLRVARNHMTWIAGVTAFCIAIATTYAMTTTPVYEASAIVRIRAPSPVPGTTPTLGEPLEDRASLSDAELQLIKTRSVLAPVIDAFHLDITAYVETPPIIGRLLNPILKKMATDGVPSKPWFGLRRYGWGGERIAVGTLQVPAVLEDAPLTLIALANGRYALQTASGGPLLTGQVGAVAAQNGVTIQIDTLIARPGTHFIVSKSNPLNASAQLASGLYVSDLGKDKDTGVIQLSYDSPDPVLASAVTNAIVQSAIQQNVERHRAAANAMLGFLTTELPRLRARVQDADQALSDYRGKSNSIESTQEAQVYLDGSIEFQKQIAYLTIQRTQLLQRFEPNSVAVQTVDAQIRELADTQHSFDARFKKMPVALRESADLERNANVAQDIYLALVNRMQALSVERGGTVGDLSVIDPAWPPTIPVKPQKGLIIAASVLFGFVLSAASLLAYRRLRNRVDDPGVLERKLGLPMFGGIFFSASQATLPSLQMSPPSLSMPRVRLPDGSEADVVEATIVARPKEASRHTGGGIPRLSGPASIDALALRWPNDLSIEALRNLRTELQFALSDTPSKVVLITSPGPASGKSFIAVNLAVLLAEAGLNVLLVDGDLRHGKLGQVFSKPGDRIGGLTDVLAGHLAAEAAIHATTVSRLSLMHAGPQLADPSALLAGPLLGELLADMGAKFDMVLVDSPPTLGISDAAVLARWASASIVVLREGMHSEQEVAETLQKLERAGGRVLAGVFNAVPGKRSDRQRYAYEANIASAQAPRAKRTSA